MTRRTVILFLSVACLTAAVSGSFSQARQHPGIREIPDATTGTSDEAKWWQDLKSAAEAVRDSHGEKKKTAKFRELMQLGEENSYQPPVPDSKPFILYKAQPGYTEQARQRRINGRVVLKVELRPDGFIGEVTILSGLDYGLNERALDASRAIIFVPAVKDRKFASYVVNVEQNFLVF